LSFSVEELRRLAFEEIRRTVLGRPVVALVVFGVGALGGMSSPTVACLRSSRKVHRPSRKSAAIRCPVLMNKSWSLGWSGRSRDCALADRDVDGDSFAFNEARFLDIAEAESESKSLGRGNGCRHSRSGERSDNVLWCR